MAERETTHVIVTDEGEWGYSAQSPQVPGFVYGRPTYAEFERDYRKVLSEVGVKAPVQAHRQRRFVTPEGGEYVIRFAHDEHIAHRMLVADSLQRIMSTDQRFELLENAKTSTGEVVFVCMLASDTLGVLIDQMDPRADMLTLAAPVSEIGVFTTQFGGGSVVQDHAGWDTLTDLGFSRDTTISELMVRLQNKEPHDRALVLA